jgi:hypothetical protein
MFKAHFISALATTNSDFPLQLWDRLTPQVKNTLNMLRPSLHQSYNFGVRSSALSIQLELVSACPPWVQGRHIRGPQIQRILGKPRYGRLVRWAINGPIPMQSFFCSQYPGLQSIWICRTVPTALPSPVPYVERASPRNNW